MTTQRMLRIFGLVAAAHGGACGTVPSDAGTPGGPTMPDAAVDLPPPMPTARSCKELLDGNPALDSGRYALASASGAPYQAYCDMKTGGGGWTLVLKADGAARDSQFGYDSPLWTSTTTFRDEPLDTSRAEAKYRAFSEVAFSQIGIVMQEASTATMTLDVSGTSLASVMRGPFLQLSRTRTQWLGLIADAVMQPDCNQGGINDFVDDPYVRVRIGMLGNYGANCLAPDSFIGVGGGGGGQDPCYPFTAQAPFVPPSVGVLGGGTCTSTPSIVPPNRPAFAQVYVR